MNRNPDIPRPGPKQRAAVASFLAFITICLFGRAVLNDFINLDDPAYFTENPHIREGFILRDFGWALTTGWGGNWHPLTWASHIVDAHLFGSGPMAPHLINVLFHAANAALLFLIWTKMTGKVWCPALIAALFAWHPQRVESVAWVAERKDVLSGLFFMLTLWAYAGYCERGKSEGEGVKIPDRTRFNAGILFRAHGTGFYFLALALFCLGLMSKPMLVTLPFVLVLLDWWPFGRFGVAGQNSMAAISRLFVEKLPFFALTICSSIITFFVQERHGAVQHLSDLPLKLRLENAVVSYVVYLGKAFWPVNLATPYPGVQPLPTPVIAICAGILIVITTTAILLRRTSPAAFVGWFWFIGMLVPVIGIVQVGEQCMADRYTYLPSIGLWVAVGWAAIEFSKRSRFCLLIFGSAVVLVLSALVSLTSIQLSYWKSTESLLKHTIAVTKRNWIARYNLGCELDRQGRTDEAVDQYARAAFEQPFDVDILNNLGCDLARKKSYAEALPVFKRALKLKPDRADSHYNLARCLVQLKRPEDAIPEFESFLNHNPRNVVALREYGVSLALVGRVDEATAQLQQAVHLQPSDPEAHFNLGEALAVTGKTAQARAELEEALRLKPDWEQARQQLNSLRAEPVNDGPQGNFPK